jgi:hypothetical protein
MVMRKLLISAAVGLALIAAEQAHAEAWTCTNPAVIRDFLLTFGDQARDAAAIPHGAHVMDVRNISQGPVSDRYIGCRGLLYFADGTAEWQYWGAYINAAGAQIDYHNRYSYQY